MLAPRVIPCLDIDDGRVVKGVKFQDLRDAGDPVENSLLYEQQGADEIVLLDISATPGRRTNNLEVIRAIRQTLSIPLTVGGGVRTTPDAARLLDAGADRVGVNTAAVGRPALIEELSREFGAQCVVVAVDAKCKETSWEVVVQSGAKATGIDAVRWCEKAEALGAGELLLTSWDRDGTGDGYDLDLIRTVSLAATIPVVASGGAASVRHMVDAFRSGASAVLAASILHDRDTTVADIKAGLSHAGIGVRR